MALRASQQAGDLLASREPGAASASDSPDSPDPSKKAPGPKPLVLVVDDDEAMCETFEQAFGYEQIETIFAHRASQGLRIAKHLDVNALILDYRLPDFEGLELIRRLHTAGREVSFILMSGYVTVPVAVEAMQLGAVTVLEKPVDIDDVLVAIRRALLTGSRATRRAARPHVPHETRAAPAGDSSQAPPSSTAERWAMLVLRALASPSDFRTLDAWARAVHLSRSALTECCRLVHISPRDARDFARLLRAIAHTHDVWHPEALMDFADSRTLQRVLRRAGLADTTQVPTIDDFLSRQQWIPTDNPALAALRAAFRDRARLQSLEQSTPR
jgi:ActR/RegA family two-component response regulator